MPIACYQIMSVHLYLSCICFTVLLAYDIFTLTTACIFTITCLLTTYGDIFSDILLIPEEYSHDLFSPQGWEMKLV